MESIMSESHDAKGRFKKGHKGGPGRPRRVVELDYLLTLSDAVPPDRWRKIIERAIVDAENGDAKAREWIGNYLMGKPSGDALERKSKADDYADRKERGELTFEEQMCELGW
jgi:hypothetical protein